MYPFFHLFQRYYINWKMYTKVHKHNYRVNTTFISINYYVYAQKKI